MISASPLIRNAGSRARGIDPTHTPPASRPLSAPWLPNYPDVMTEGPKTTYESSDPWFLRLGNIEVAPPNVFATFVIRDLGPEI